MIKNFNTFINESYTNNMVWLKNYLTQSLDKKREGLGYNYSWLIPDWVEQTGVDYPETEDIDYDSLPDDAKIEFDEWLYDLFDNVKYKSLGVEPTDAPTWTFMDYESLVRNEWLVHFTDNASGIVENGFIYGVDDITKLGLTVFLPEIDKKYGGYNFGFDSSDVERYVGTKNGKTKYGKEAVVFMASGIKVTHYADEESQIIFYGKDANHINSIYFNKDSWKWILESKDGKSLVTKDTIGELLNWLKENYPQYQKQLN